MSERTTVADDMTPTTKGHVDVQQACSCGALIDLDKSACLSCGKELRVMTPATEPSPARSALFTLDRPRR